MPGAPRRPGRGPSSHRRPPACVPWPCCDRDNPKSTKHAREPAYSGDRGSSSTHHSRPAQCGPADNRFAWDFPSMLMRPACQQPERAGCEFHMYSASKICIVERKGRRLKPEQQHLPWKDPGLTWSQLRGFEACARLSSFNAAAAELNLTASAVRHQAGLLEARIGVKLLERQGGRLSLTSTGT